MLLAGGLPLALTRYCGRRARQGAARRRDRSRPLGPPYIDRGRRDRRGDHGRLRTGGRDSAGCVVHRGSRRRGVADPTRSVGRPQRAAEVASGIRRRCGHGRCRRCLDGPRALGRRRDRRHVRRRGRRDAREPRLALVAVSPRRGHARLARAGRPDPPPRLPALRLHRLAGRDPDLRRLAPVRVPVPQPLLDRLRDRDLLGRLLVGRGAAPDPAGDRRRALAGRGDAARRGGDRAHPPGLRAGDQAAPRAHAPDDRVRDRARPADAARRLRPGLQRRRPGRRAPADSAADRDAHEPEQGRARRDGQAALPARERRGRRGRQHRARLRPDPALRRRRRGTRERGRAARFRAACARVRNSPDRSRALGALAAGAHLARVDRSRSRRLARAGLARRRGGHPRRARGRVGRVRRPRGGAPDPHRVRRRVAGRPDRAPVRRPSRAPDPDLRAPHSGAA